ncbi:MAG: SUF system NifU family Fe-S cluster assembly protein [Candidatus Neomarinimicrobiota bacterium]|jgi:nitrogen fixation NifU-like protein|nr:SUF system NifU family Fe-S cluster assembly protein [Candidatus Neomarinimicrobiota bacterium]
MNDLRELYQQLILDHNQSPRNFKKLEDFDFHKHGHNPLCGDQLEIFIKLKKDTITNLTFIGSGCAISKASASIMTETLIGKTISEANLVFNKFREMAKSGEVSEELPMKLTVLSGIYKYPARVKCALLAWHTMHQTFYKTNTEIVNTEIKYK